MSSNPDSIIYFQFQLNILYVGPHLYEFETHSW